MKAHGRSAAHFPMKSRDSMQMNASEPALTDDNARPRRHTFTIPLKAPNVSSHTSGASKPPSLWGGFHFNVTYFNSGPVRHKHFYTFDVSTNIIDSCLRWCSSVKTTTITGNIMKPVTNALLQHLWVFISFGFNHLLGKVLSFFTNVSPTQPCCNSPSLFRSARQRSFPSSWSCFYEAMTLLLQRCASGHCHPEWWNFSLGFFQQGPEGFGATPAVIHSSFPNSG